MEYVWAALSCNLKQAAKASLVDTPNAGRGLVASQDLLREEVILEESPIVVGPPQSLGPHFCVHCSQPLTIGLLQGSKN